MEEKTNNEEAASKFVAQQEMKELPSEKKQKGLGKARGYEDIDQHKPLVADIGWINLKLSEMPSQGLFYPQGTQIAIRAATGGEIRHWSSIDENNEYVVNSMINYIIEKCARIKFPDSPSTWKDIKEVDRLYILFAIREWTFKDGENKIYVSGSDGEKIEVRKEMLDYFNVSDKLKKFYDADKRCFSFSVKKTGETFNMYIPSIGVSQFITNYGIQTQREGGTLDESFFRYSLFMFKSHRGLDKNTYIKAMRDSVSWSLEKISAISRVVEIFQHEVDPTVVYKIDGGEERRASMNFRGGLKGIFIISDILDELE